MIERNHEIYTVKRYRSRKKTIRFSRKTDTNSAQRNNKNGLG